MRLIKLEQGTDEWLEWRTGGVTASEISIILNQNPYKKRSRLIEEKLGIKKSPNLAKNPHVIRGNELEPMARELYSCLLLKNIQPACGEHDKHSWLRASFDGLDKELIPYEFKAPSINVWNDVIENGVESKAYKMYLPQVKYQCLVSGANYGFLIFYLNDEEFIDFKINVSAKDKREYTKEAKQFLKDLETKRKELDEVPF